MRKAKVALRAVGVAAFVLGAAVMIGCDKKDESTKPAADGAPATAATAVTGKGILRGHVKFSGTAPVLKPVDRDCHPGGPKMVIPDESVLVSPAGELKNVIVFLKNPPAGGATAQPAPIIDQKDCVSMDNGEYNQSIAKGDTKSYPVKAAGFFKAKCDIHPWMVCCVGAFDHPYFAVTRDDGSFEFRDLPPGRYTLGFWQEKLGQRTLADVAVADDKPADVTFTYEPKKP
jgi:hypothetical protein